MMVVFTLPLTLYSETIAAIKPLILSDGVQGINGKSKWRNENFDHCFDEVGDKLDSLLSEFLQQNMEQEGGASKSWWYDRTKLLCRVLSEEREKVIARSSAN